MTTNTVKHMPDTREWQDISTARELDRVIVAGWQPRSGATAGYWWFHEDVIFDGKPIDHPAALLWHPFPELPKHPPAPQEKGR